MTSSGGQASIHAGQKEFCRFLFFAEHGECLYLHELGFDVGCASAFRVFDVSCGSGVVAYFGVIEGQSHPGGATARIV